MKRGGASYTASCKSDKALGSLLSVALSSLAAKQMYVTLLERKIKP